MINVVVVGVLSGLAVCSFLAHRKFKLIGSGKFSTSDMHNLSFQDLLAKTDYAKALSATFFVAGIQFSIAAISLLF